MRGIAKLLNSQLGFSLMEILVGGAVLLTAGYAFYNVTVAHEQGAKSIEVGSDLRSSVRGVLEAAIQKNQYSFAPLAVSDDSEDRIGLYYLCSRFERKTYLSRRQKSSDPNAVARQQVTVKTAENQGGDLDYGVLVLDDSDYDLTQDGECQADKLAELFTVSNLEPAQLSSLNQCLVKAQIGLQLDENQKSVSCPNSNVVTFLYLFANSPHVLSWSFKLNKQRDTQKVIGIEKGVIEWGVLPIN